MRALSAANWKMSVSEGGLALTEPVMIEITALVVVPRSHFSPRFDPCACRKKLHTRIQFARKAAVARRRYECVAAVSAIAIETESDNNETAT